MMDIQQVRTAKRKYAPSLLAKTNVVAVGVGFRERNGERTDEVCLVVSVVEKLPLAQVPLGQVIPARVGGVPTDIQQVGRVRALQARTDKWRPAPGGVSIGHHNITAGTLGCLVMKGGELFILSNNHVLADSNNGVIGDAILQPGPYDGGSSDDRIATLEDYVPIQFLYSLPPDCPVAGTVARGVNWLARLLGSRHRLRAYQNGANLVDAAIARPLLADLVDEQILEVGYPAGAVEAELGMAVEKSGRTTGLTAGTITQVDVTVQVAYPPNIAIFEDQLASDIHSEGGDSGSVVVDVGNHAAGLLFAGGEGITILNRAGHVEAALGVQF